MKSHVCQVSKNPEGKCNPQLGEEKPLSICLGIVVAVMSLMWVSFSTTSYKNIIIKEIFLATTRGFLA
jgi:hypothetical protein